MDDRPRISVIVAAYRPGDGFLRVIESLDAQTLPQDQFETIVIDDGSPDDTFERLQQHAATRPNMTVRRIENSGWPSRPRNLATQMARGEWVLFMDHDDSLYPDALRRAAEYAAETDADLLSPKESKTSDVWWGMPALAAGNIPDARATSDIDVLMPMVPHKFYRREFLLEHGIRFPEGRRMLWEDIYVNVEAWRHARKVAVLADTPVYLWHSSATNNSKTYGPRTAEFWDRLDDLFAFIDRTLDAPGYQDNRRTTLLHQYRDRVLGRFSRMLAGATSEERTMALARARRIQEAYVPLDWEQHLGVHDRARAVLLRAERTDLLEQLAAIDATFTSRAEVERAEWVEGRLQIDVRASYAVRGAGPLGFRRVGDRVLRVLPDELAAALPPEALDVTDRLDGLKLSVGIRHRVDRVTWELPHDPQVAFESVGGDLVTPVVRTTVTVDLERAALGAPLSDAVWDHNAAIRWEGLARGTALKYTGPARAALVAGRAAVAYRNQRDYLTLDTSGRLRNVVKDSRPGIDDFAGTVGRLVVALPEIHIAGSTELPAAAVLSPVGRRDEPDGADIELLGSVVGGPDGARLEVAGEAPPGNYRLAFRVGGGSPLVSVFLARVDRDGDFEVVRRPPAAARPPAMARARSWGRRTWRRVTATARTAAKRIRASR